jgi:hypothetical protein
MKTNVKIVVALLVIAVALTAGVFIKNYNTEKPIVIVNPSAKTSPATVFGKAVQKSLDAQFYQAANCEDAVAKYGRTTNSVYIYNSSIEFAARNKGLKCLLAEEKDKTVLFYGGTPMYICRLPGSTKDFGPAPTTLGMASMYATKSHENLFKKGGANVKIVPYSGSKTVLAALLAGDVDLGWMGSGLARKQKGKIECLYSTNPGDKNFLGNKVDNGIPNFTITYVIYTNARGDKAEEIKYKLASDPNFLKFLKTSNTSGTFDAAGKDQLAIRYVDALFSQWADK